MRTSYQYRISANSYAPYNRVLGTAIIALTCIIALQAFTSAVVITGKNLPSRIIPVATIAQVTSIAAITVVIADPAILTGFVSSVVTAIATCTLLHRTIK